jgi:glycine betaine/proline transport system ATP-binding protein
MVRHPADDYVREFTKNAPRDRIVTLAAIATASRAKPKSEPLEGRMKLGEAAARVLASDMPLGVVGNDGQFLGVVTREAMIAALYPSEGQ